MHSNYNFILTFTVHVCFNALQLACVLLTLPVRARIIRSKTSAVCRILITCREQRGSPGLVRAREMPQIYGEPLSHSVESATEAFTRTRTGG